MRVTSRGRKLCVAFVVATVIVVLGHLPSQLLRAASPDSAPALPAPSGQVINVSSESQLQAAVSQVGSGGTIMIQPGTYVLSNTLYFNRSLSNVTVRGATNNRNDVVLRGTGMTGSGGNVPFGIWTGNGVTGMTIANLTIRDVNTHPIMLNAGTQSPRIYNVRLVNAGEQFVKANPDGSGGGVNQGVVEYSMFEYDSTSRDAYTNGVDVHSGQGWIIRNNAFIRIRAPQGQLAGPAILMWNHSSDTIAEGNAFLDCAREISFGLVDQAGTDHSGGIIRNNFITRTSAMNGYASDVAIAVFDSPNTRVVNNTVMLNGQYPNSIEYRFSGSSGVVITNNLADRPAQARDGATASSVQGNVWNASNGLFVNAGGGDLHLLATATAVIDHGVATGDATTDWDNQTRLGTPDVGADEYFASSPPPQPGPPPPPPPPSEVCGDGIDNDRDGQIDENCPTTPPQPPTPPTPPPPTEVCGDGVDNDSDGQVDEGCPSPQPTPVAPGAPARLMGRVRGSAVHLSWLAPIAGSAPAGYLIEAGVQSGQTLASVPVGQTTSLTVPGVGPGKYYVRIRSGNAVGLSAPSNEVSFTVGCGQAPRAPRASAPKTNGPLVSFAWVDPDGCSDTSYHLLIGSAQGAMNLANVAVDAQSFVAPAPPGVYYSRIVSVSSTGISTPSNEMQVSVGAGACQPPSFATQLSGNAAGGIVSLTWMPTSASAAQTTDAFSPIEYLLEAGTAPGASNLGTFRVGRALSVATAAPPGTFYVRVRPANACGLGPASSDVAVQVH